MSLKEVNECTEYSLMDPHCNDYESTTSCYTSIKTAKCSCMWTIENYSYFFFTKRNGERISGSKFSSTANEVCWRLHLYPRGRSDFDLNCFTIQLELLSSIVRTVWTHIRFSFLNSRKEEIFALAFEKKVHVGGNLESPLMIDLFRQKKNVFLSNDTLRVKCDVIAAISEELLQWPIIKGKQMIDARLPNDYSSLFEEPEFSDIIVRVGSKEFHMHKCILSARSSVFRAMLKHEMQEAKTSRVLIPDFNADVMEQFLRFLYSGRKPTIDEDMARELLRAADKYSVPTLAAICEHILLSSIALENVCENLLLAYNHNQETLKKGALAFFRNNAWAILKSKEWKTVSNGHPELILFILNSLFTTD